ncbi:MAG TPA: hypothetical protein VMS31_05490 [Pyrinomonadaceae bacterium]|nr:hypothetical protein [Pyrinomonadaceae bacterium]
MRTFIVRIIFAGLILASMTVIGLAKENKRQVTFDEPVKVNGTLVKAGTYEVIFADETGQLTIFKGKKSVAQASARLEKLETKTGQRYAVWSEVGNSDEPKVLTSVTLQDGYQAKLVNAGDLKAEGSN